MSIHMTPEGVKRMHYEYVRNTHQILDDMIRRIRPLVTELEGVSVSHDGEKLLVIHRDVSIRLDPGFLLMSDEVSILIYCLKRLGYGRID